MATDNHPFWVADVGGWLAAADLRPGNLLRTSAGTYAQVTAVRTWQEYHRVHNLTVADIHTYHVIAGNTPVFVHNTGPGCDLDANGWPIPTMDNCHACAKKIQEQIGGDIYHIKDAYGAPGLGPSKHDPYGSWTEHYAVIKDGIVYDGFTGRTGMPLDAYRAQWKHGQYLDFSSVG